MPSAFSFRYQIFHFARADRVQTAGRLVEQNQIGIVDQCLGQPKRRAMPLEYSRNWRRRGPAQPDHFDQSRQPLLANRGGHIEQAAVEIERLFGIQKPVQIGFFRQIADALVLRDFGGVFAEHNGPAAGGKQQAQ